jgi:hypothetical protein
MATSAAPQHGQIGSAPAIVVSAPSAVPTTHHRFAKTGVGFTSQLSAGHSGSGQARKTQDVHVSFVVTLYSPYAAAHVSMHVLRREKALPYFFCASLSARRAESEAP